jgi:dolichol-phosphate mannosyltransferase
MTGSHESGRFHGAEAVDVNIGASPEAAQNRNGHGEAAFDRPHVSVVLPTREEAGNVAAIAARLEQVLPGMPLEIIFVDDSDDDTPDAIRSIRSSRPVRLHHRPADKRWGGLGGAVVEGIQIARGEWVCVMDADLQHPPETLEDMLAQAEATAAQVVVASRFCPGGGVGPFKAARKAMSRVSSRTALTLFPGLRHVTDPMSGFFLVRRDALDLDRLHPHGFKILLEILVRTPGLRVTEVPFEFGARHAGKTKASIREVFRFGKQLGHLGVGRFVARFGRFGVVGATGLLVNTVLMALLAGPLGVGYIAAAILATQGSTLWNFALTETWVFSDRRHKRGLGNRMGMFFLMNNIALPLRIPILFALTSMLGIHYLVSNVLSLVALTVLRFAIADKMIWGKADGRLKNVRSYDVHGIVTVTSDTRLPELDRFAVDHVIAQPSIRVRIGTSRAVVDGLVEWDAPANGNGHVNGYVNGNGHVNGNGYAPIAELNGNGHGQAPAIEMSANGHGDEYEVRIDGDVPSIELHGNGNGHGSNGHGPTLNGDKRCLRYVEGRRGLGFGIAIEQIGERIEVLATPLLERSPHVLYTNVVEPIMRWLLASKGYALVHGACFANDGEAMMVTARTDTGKTTTCLKLLDRQPYSFLSDDLTILCADGRVLCYPKPLTISRHTLHAVNSPLLSRRQRVGLIIQSRIHSRTGRRFAFRIAGMKIPAATVNALVQRMIPPPKYQIDKLVPSARVTSEAQLSALVVIERGHDRKDELETGDAVAVLMENCEDAFGFPPYSHIEEFLQGLNGGNLKHAERAIVESAFSTVTARVIGSSTMDWWQELPSLGSVNVRV